MKTAVTLLEEYLAKHANKVSSYARFETAPLRMIAHVLLQLGESERAVDLARRAYTNANHRCPMDFVVYGLALETIGEKAEAVKIADEALLQNDQIEEAIALKKRLRG